MWVRADERRRTRPKQSIRTKNVMFWVCFIPIEIVDLVMLPPEEMFDRSFFADIVLDSLKKEICSNSRFESRKGPHFAFG
jgi:hypothetical protein